MRAWRYAAFGPVAEVLRLEDIAAPRPGASDVLIRTHHAGINPLDWKLVEGQFRLLAKSRPPCGVASELAGEIIETGAKVSGLRAGDRVVAWLNPFAQQPGALAEQVAVPAAQCVRVPAGVGLDAAAVTPVAGLSALQLSDMAGVRAGQRILVHGAAGGVGCFVVAVLRDRGAVIVATGSAGSQSFLRELQPDAQVDYATPVGTWPGPFDAVIDCAARLDPRTWPALLPNGGTVAVTLPSFPGVILDPLLNPFRRIRRKTLRLDLNAAQLEQMLAMIAEGRLPVRLTRSYRFEDAVAALVESRGGRARGKLGVAVI
ncbi:MAG TPA: NADP-dependent oxidoreductase [Burkholderiaceae bacterium]|nr:NADP-dependent oxidoreductase [Burkholderiaceae bacterium]